MVNWDGYIWSPSEWVERCCDIRVVNWLHHGGDHRAAGCWTLGLGQRPSCSAKHQEVFSKHWGYGKEGQEWVNSILTTWFLSGQEFYVLLPTGILHLGTGYIFFLHPYVFLCACKCTQKHAYKQLRNRSRNVICGLISFFTPFHYPRDRGTRISWNCPRIYELMSLPTANVSLHHTQRFQGERSLTGSSSYTWSPVLLALIPGFPVGQCLQLLRNISVHIEKFLSLPVLAEANVFQNDHCAASSPLFTGASFSKALSSWSIYTSVFSWNTENRCNSME